MGRVSLTRHASHTDSLIWQSDSLIWETDSLIRAEEHGAGPEPSQSVPRSKAEPSFASSMALSSASSAAVTSGVPRICSAAPASS